MRCSLKRRSTSTARKPFYLSGKTLLRQRRKAGARKSKSGAPGEEETGIDPCEGTKRKENSLQRDEATSGTVGPASSRATTAISTSEIHPLDSLGVTGLT